MKKSNKRKFILLAAILSFVTFGCGVASTFIENVNAVSVLAETATKPVYVNVAADGLSGGIYTEADKHKAITYEFVDDKLNILSYDQDNLENFITDKLKAMAGSTEDGNRTSVTNFLFNVCYCRALTPSQVNDSASWNYSYDESGNILTDDDGNLIKTPTTYTNSDSWFDIFRAFEAAGIDWYAVAVDQAKELGVIPGFSVRMNDYHYTTDRNVRPGFTQQFCGDSGVWDFDLKVCRDYRTNYIVELVTNYEIEVVELDFLRGTSGCWSANNDETKAVASSWLKEIRAAVDEALEGTGRNVEILARVPITEKEALEYNFDIAQWIADGSIDGFIASGFDSVTYDYPISDWRASIAVKNTENNPYKFLVGGSQYITTNGKTKISTPEDKRGVVSAAYADGADGFYTFNTYASVDQYYDTITPTGERTYHGGTADRLRENYADLGSALSANSKMRRYIVDDNIQTYPILLEGNKTWSYNLNIGEKVSGAGYYNVMVGIDDTAGWTDNNFTVRLGDVTATQIRDLPWSTQYTSENMARTNHISYAASRIMQFVVSGEKLNDLTSGRNLIQITNEGASMMQILWVSVDVNPTTTDTIEQSAYYRNNPESLEAVLTTNGVRLTWNNVGHVEKINIYRKAIDSSVYSKIATVEDAVEVYDDTTVASGQEYFYRISYIWSDVTMESAYSNTASTFVSDEIIGAIATDFITGANWNGVYGKDGYIIFGQGADTQNRYGNAVPIIGYPMNFGEQTSLVAAPAYLQRFTVNMGGGYAFGTTSGVALNKSDGTTSNYLVLASNENIGRNVGEQVKEVTATFYLNDNDTHLVSGYFVEAVASNCSELSIVIQNLNDEIIAITSIDPTDYRNGGYISFVVKGSFKISFYSQEGLDASARYGFAGFFFDDYMTEAGLFINPTIKNLSNLASKAVVEDGYAYYLKNETTVVKQNLSTGEIEAVYLEKDSNIAFSANAEIVESISVSNGVVCVNIGVYGKAKPWAARLIDFNNELTTKIFKVDNSSTEIRGVFIKGDYLYAYRGDFIYSYKLSEILQDGQYDGEYAKLNNTDVGYAAGRMIGHLTDTRGETERKVVGRLGAMIVQETGDEYDAVVLLPNAAKNGEKSTTIAITETVDGTIKHHLGSTNSIIYIDELLADTGFTSYYSDYARVGDGLVCILNNAGQNIDNGIIIYDYVSTLTPTYQKTISFDCCSITAFELYGNYLLIACTDNRVRVVDIRTEEILCSYDYVDVPVAVTMDHGCVIVELNNGSLYSVKLNGENNTTVKEG